LGQLQQVADGAQALSYDANGLYQSLGATFQTPGGLEIPRAEELYRKFGAIQQGSANLQAVTEDVLSRRESLRQQIAATTQQLQAATTDAETQKLTGVLIGYNAELGAVDREIENAAAQLTAQDIENRADKERQDEARREERRAQMEEGVRRFGEVFRLDTSAPAFPAQR
jgi:chromosome segregation ATPase